MPPCLGQGFTPTNGATAVHGLRGMSNRARIAGGTFKVESAAGKGTRILVDLVLLAALQSADVRQQPLLDGDDVDHGEFEALGRVHGHDGDAVLVLVPAVEVGGEGDVLQKVGDGAAGVLLAELVGDAVDADGGSLCQHRLGPPLIHFGRNASV